MLQLITFHRSARKDSKNSPNNTLIQSAKRSYVDLTGEDEVYEKSKNSNTSKSKSIHKVVDVSQSGHIGTLSSYVNTTHKRSYQNTAAKPQKQNVDAFATFQRYNRVTDQPQQKRVKVINRYKGSDSEDELPTDEVGRSSSTEAKGALCVTWSLIRSNFLNAVRIFSYHLCSIH